MDCCNYMQFRSHRQPYGYEPAYYDHFNDYNHSTDFYGQHNVYHDYYNSQYYPHQWTQVPSFTDYVYNPKEARMRKAMREASRDRSLGASPMLPRPGTRLPPPHTEWAQPSDEPLIMNHMENMRNMEAQMCGYPLSAHENQYMSSPMNEYNKIDPPPSMMSNYMQPNPLAQLQQQTEMWHTYQDNMRSRSMATPYHHRHQMLPEMQSSPIYHSQEPIQDTPTNLIMEKPRQSPGCAKSTLSRNVSPRSIPDENPTNNQSQPHFMETNIPPTESIQPNMIGDKSHDNQYLPVADTMMTFEATVKAENVTPKKPRGRPPTKKFQPPPPTPKPLPDFNEAFGSTERGRFLSPPDPRLNKGYLDLIFENDMKFEDFQM